MSFTSANAGSVQGRLVTPMSRSLPTVAGINYANALTNDLLNSASWYVFNKEHDTLNESEFLTLMGILAVIPAVTNAGVQNVVRPTVAPAVAAVNAIGGGFFAMPNALVVSQYNMVATKMLAVAAGYIIKKGQTQSWSSRDGFAMTMLEQSGLVNIAQYFGVFYELLLNGVNLTNLYVNVNANALPPVVWYRMTSAPQLGIYSALCACMQMYPYKDLWARFGADQEIAQIYILWRNAATVSQKLQLSSMAGTLGLIPTPMPAHQNALLVAGAICSRLNGTLRSFYNGERSFRANPILGQQILHALTLYDTKLNTGRIVPVEDAHVTLAGQFKMGGVDLAAVLA